MPYTLLIVESPAKCQKIESYLGSGYKCIASYGHIQELPGLKNIDIENNFKPSFLPMESKSHQITKIRKMISGAKEVLLASDDDREGEAIGWHICQVFNLPLTTKRIIFHEITKDAIVKAVNNPTTLNIDIIYAQQARQILDVIVGYKISPMLWKHISRKTATGLSAGRCQTPALRIVYDNQKDIDNSPGKKVYNTTGYFSQMNLGFSLNHNFEIIGFNSTTNTMEQFLEKSVHHDHLYSYMKPKQTTKNPPIPFTTSSLQQKASSELNISPKETMSICQKLYEAGLITYMRTDSTTYSADFIDVAGEFIKDKYGNDYLHEDVKRLSERKAVKPKKISKKTDGKSKKKADKDDDNNAQEAHEAIRPTDVTCEKIDDDSFTARERKMYHIIWSVTVESCMSPALYQSISAKITAPMDKEYKYNTELVNFPGWKIVRGYEKENPEFQFLQSIKNNVIVQYNKITCKVSIKDLKSHYTEAKLVQLLEENGIGRPSTFSSLIDKIQERGYVKKDNVKGKKIKCIDYELVQDELAEIEDEREFGNEKGKLVIQPLGILVLEFLLQHFEKLFDYEYTRNMETELDSIAKGNTIWHQICKSCLEDINECAKDLGEDDKQIIKIDDKHTYMIGKYGPVIKCGTGDKTTFLPVKKDIDIDKLKKNQYKLQDIVETQGTSSSGKSIGKYKGDDVFIKQGKFGNYITWGKDNKKSLNGIKTPVDELAIDDLIPIIENKVTLNTSIVRNINDDISIRSGKFGNYIFYKTHSMSKPKFIKLAGFKGNYNTCPEEEIERFVDSSK